MTLDTLNACESKATRLNGCLDTIQNRLNSPDVRDALRIVELSRIENADLTDQIILDLSKHAITALSHAIAKAEIRADQRESLACVAVVKQAKPLLIAITTLIEMNFPEAFSRRPSGDQ